MSTKEPLNKNINLPSISNMLDNEKPKTLQENNKEFIPSRYQQNIVNETYNCNLSNIDRSSNSTKVKSYSSTIPSSTPKTIKPAVTSKSSTFG